MSGRKNPRIQHSLIEGALLVIHSSHASLLIHDPPDGFFVEMKEVFLSHHGMPGG